MNSVEQPFHCCRDDGLQDFQVPGYSMKGPKFQLRLTLSDMLFTVADIVSVCTLSEVDMAGNHPGDVGSWNTHFRMGDSRVQIACTGAPADCMAAFAFIHLTPSSSAYIENM